ncbi:MAG TPA: hypothetical protein VGZ47_18550 [Gemmataceae bacterium]|jgi:hypothetical protein|nr:hypothetical protein [Gemmataceae bacterium]
MNAGLLSSLFGSGGRWSGPCTLIVSADASAEAIGSDSIVQGGQKFYAPRLITGRIVADAVRLLPEQTALIAVRRHVIRQSAGDDRSEFTMIVVNTDDVVAVEFRDLRSLSALGIQPPSLES